MKNASTKNPKNRESKNTFLLTYLNNQWNWILVYINWQKVLLKRKQESSLSEPREHAFGIVGSYPCNLGIYMKNLKWGEMNTILKLTHAVNKDRTSSLNRPNTEEKGKNQTLYGNGRVQFGIMEQLNNSGQVLPNITEELNNSGQALPNITEELNDSGQVLPNITEELNDSGKVLPNITEELSDSGQTLFNITEELNNSGQVLFGITEELNGNNLVKFGKQEDVFRKQSNHNKSEQNTLAEQNMMDNSEIMLSARIKKVLSQIRKCQFQEQSETHLNKGPFNQ